MVEPLVDRYLAYDIEARVDDVDYIGDVEDMGAVPINSFDSILCGEVLEHTYPTPAARSISSRVSSGRVAPSS